jgi:hypothetical protein
MGSHQSITKQKRNYSLIHILNGGTDNLPDEWVGPALHLSPGVDWPSVGKMVGFGGILDMVLVVIGNLTDFPLSEK